jgi:hypothetical protein
MTRQLYRATANTYTLHSKALSPRTRGTPQCIDFHLDPHDHDDTTLPTDAIPVDLETHPRYYTISRTIPSIQTAPTLLPAQSWDVYISHLDTWEKDILQHNQILHTDLLLKILHSIHKVFIALDGGAHDPLGSFGCLIATKSKILAENGGQASGANPRSFCAKGYGMLSILQLLYIYRPSPVMLLDFRNICYWNAVIFSW